MNNFLTFNEAFNAASNDAAFAAAFDAAMNNAGVNNIPANFVVGNPNLMIPNVS